jgi:hypothetical protein
MDIFTTQLTRVVPVKLKPETLKVKGLTKDAKSSSLNSEHDHLDGHELNTMTQQHAQVLFQGEKNDEQQNASTEKGEQDNVNEHSVDLEADSQTIPTEHPSLTREDLAKQATSNKKHLTNDSFDDTNDSQGKDGKEDKESKPEHLDIFV